MQMILVENLYTVVVVVAVFLLLTGISAVIHSYMYCTGIPPRPSIMHWERIR